MDYYLRGQLAKAVGINVETLRYYEKINLIPTPTRNKSGYREYSKETLNRLEFIRQAQDCGFSIEEIKHILFIIENPEECDTNCDEIIDRKIGEINKKIREMQFMKDMLSEIKDSLKKQNCPYIRALLKK
jgi:DNA-binding transcriptional MerR regulator